MIVTCGHSSIVLTWIQGTSTHWKTFVGNRVALIQEATSGATWRHVHLHRTLLTSFHEELVQQHFLQMHYGGMDLDGSCMTISLAVKRFQTSNRRIRNQENTCGSHHS
jgi:hypothetical protein